MRRPAVSLLLIASACSGGGGGTSATDGTTGGSTGGATATTSDGSDSAPTGAPTDSGPASSSGAASSTGATAATETGGTVTGELTGSSGGDTGGTGETAGSTTAVSGSTGEGTGGMGECMPREMEACYSGPPDTLGVGACAAGQRTCEGGQWGPCLGEVLPASETCDAPGDEDCDGVDPCTGDGAFAWARVFGGAGDESGMKIAFDGAGNLVLAAQGTSSLDFGGGALNSAGGYDLFVARFAPDGTHLWSKRFGDAANQFNDGFALAVDAAGQIALAGDFEGTIDFGGGPLVAKNVGDPFLVRLGPDGSHVWSKAFKTGSYAYPQAVTFDPDGNLLLGGFFFVSLDLGGGVMTSAGMVDAFIGKFDAAGAHVWSQRFGDGQGQFVLGVAAGAGGEVYLGGGFSGVINLGKGQMTSAGGNDVFLGRLDKNGTAVWSKRFGDAQSQVLRDLVIDGQGRLSFGGDMQGTIDLGGGPLGGGGSRSYVAQFDGAGAHLWSRLISDGQANVRGVAVDGPGAVLVTGDFSGVADFGGGKLTSEGSNDIFVVKLGPGGQHVWSQRFGDFQGQVGRDVAGSSAGFTAVAGSFAGGVNFGGGPLNSKGGNDGFVAVLGP